MSIKFGNRSEFNSNGATINIAAEALSATKVVVVYEDTTDSDKGKAKIAVVTPKMKHPIEKDPVKSRMDPKINGPTIAPDIVIKFTKPEAVPITWSGSHSDKSGGRSHHIVAKNRMTADKAMVV